MSEILGPGWCCYAATRDCVIGAVCVSGPQGYGMRCVRCEARDIGLPETATAEEVVAANNGRRAAA